MVAARGVAGACVFARVKQGKGEKEITCVYVLVCAHA